MAGLIQRNGTYYAVFTDETRTPRQKRISLKTRDKSAARRTLVKWERRYERNDFDPWYDDPWQTEESGYRSIELSAAIKAFLAAKKADGLKASSLQTYEDMLRLFEKRCGGRTKLSAITPVAINSWLREKHLSQASQRCRFTHLRAFIRWSVKQRYLKKNPLDDVKSPAVPKQTLKAITAEQLEKICTATEEMAQETGYGHRWRIPLFKFAYYTGLRANELGRLRWGHVDMKRRRLAIFEQKNGDEQWLPLTKAAVKVLQEMKPGDAEDYVFASYRTQKERSINWFVNSVSNGFRKARERAKRPSTLTFHSLRHGFCTALAEAGVNAHVIQKAARHKDIATTARYVSLTNEALRDHLNDVFG